MSTVARSRQALPRPPARSRSRRYSGKVGPIAPYFRPLRAAICQRRASERPRTHTHACAHPGSGGWSSLEPPARAIFCGAAPCGRAPGRLENREAPRGVGDVGVPPGATRRVRGCGEHPNRRASSGGEQSAGLASGGGGGWEDDSRALAARARSSSVSLQRRMCVRPHAGNMRVRRLGRG